MLMDTLKNIMFFKLLYNVDFLILTYGFLYFTVLRLYIYIKDAIYNVIFVK